MLQEGYELIANCLERPGAETRAIAQRYYDEQLTPGCGAIFAVTAWKPRALRVYMMKAPARGSICWRDQLADLVGERLGEPDVA